MKKLNIAIIGCGRVAGHHARSIKYHSDRLNLVAMCDIKKERLQEMTKIHDVPGYENYHQMLKEHPEIDVVSVVTPSGAHPEHTKDIISNYKKHIVVEKPMVMRISQGAEIKKLAQENVVRVFPVFQYRFNKAVQFIKNSVQKQDELGDIFLATVRTRWCRPQRYYDRDPWRGTFSHDGGACTNQGIHHLDLLRFLAGEVKRVNATMKTFGANIEVEDTVVANIEFESGAVGVIEITTAARPDDFESSISVVCKNGIAMVGGWATNELTEFSPNPEMKKEVSEEFEDVYGYGHRSIYLGVWETLCNNGHPAVEYDDGLKSIKLLQAIYRSAEEGDWVDVETADDSKRLGEQNEEIAKLYRVTPLAGKEV